MRRFYSWICQHWGCLCSPGSEYPHLEFPRAGRIMGAQSCSHLKSPEPRTLGGRLQDQYEYQRQQQDAMLCVSPHDI